MRQLNSPSLSQKPLIDFSLKPSSQHSIQKVVSFAVKYFPPCGEDIWDCIIEETEKVCLYTAKEAGHSLRGANFLAHAGFNQFSNKHPLLPGLTMRDLANSQISLKV